MAGEAGEELSIPVIIMLYPTMMETIPASVFAAITKKMAKTVKIPVVYILTTAIRTKRSWARSETVLLR